MIGPTQFTWFFFLALINQIYSSGYRFVRSMKVFSFALCSSAVISYIQCNSCNFFWRLLHVRTCTPLSACMPDDDKRPRYLILFLWKVVKENETWSEGDKTTLNNRYCHPNCYRLHPASESSVTTWVQRNEALFRTSQVSPMWQSLSVFLSSVDDAGLAQSIFPYAASDAILLDWC